MILDSSDEQLISNTRNFLKKHFKKERHHVACGILTADGVPFYALHLDTSGHDICAEPIAVSSTLTNDVKGNNLKTIVSIHWNGNEDIEPLIITPCGDCRQMLYEYAPNVNVVVKTDDTLKKEPITDLLPYAYVKPRSK